VVLNLTSVSKQHATLTVQSDGKVFVRDLGSKNGTKVNGKAVGETPVLVKSPQVISLGGNELSVLDPGAFYDLLTEFLVAT
jgi:pSer/pThr/pTyr-binding forkhead associated (FHA) protein